MTNITEKRVSVVAVPAGDVHARRERFSKTLSFQAGKGRFSTRPIPFKQVHEAPNQTAQPDVADPRLQISQAAPQETAAPVALASGEARAESAVQAAQPTQEAPETSTDSAPAVESAQPDPVHQALDSGSAGTGAPSGATSSAETVLERMPLPGKLSRAEIVISIAATRELTRLFCALTVDPGSGREVDAQTRTEVLNRLIGHAHEMADALSRRVVNDSTLSPPLALRAKMLQASTTFLSRQWIETGHIDPQPFMALATDALFAKAQALTTDVLALMDEAGQRSPIDSDEKVQAHITQACVEAAFTCQRSVAQFSLHDYDQASPAGAFTYGRPLTEVAHDLTQATLGLAKEFDTTIADRELQSVWTKNTIWRASELVCAEYTTITDRALRAAFNDTLTADAAVADLTRRYPDILKNVTSRALASLQAIERNAVDTMSALSYKAYLPRLSSAREDTATIEAKGQKPTPAVAQPEQKGLDASAPSILGHLQKQEEAPARTAQAPAAPAEIAASVPTSSNAAISAHKALNSHAPVALKMGADRQPGTSQELMTAQSRSRLSRPVAPVPVRIAVPRRGG